MALADVGYLRPKYFNRDHWAAILMHGSYARIVDGNRQAALVGYQNIWNYNSVTEASRALHEWSGEGEPKGWLSKKLTGDMTIWP